MDKCDFGGAIFASLIVMYYVGTYLKNKNIPESAQYIIIYLSMILTAVLMYYLLSMCFWSIFLDIYILFCMGYMHV